MAIHCYGEEVKDVNIVNDPLEVNSNTKIQGSVDVNGSVNVGSAGGERIPVDVSISNHQQQLTTEDKLTLNIAIQLYSNTNFDSVKNLSKQAALCIERANTFSEVYAKFKSKEAIVDGSKITDIKMYAQYIPGNNYVDITITDVSERFIDELRNAGYFLLGFETYKKFGHKSRNRIKYKLISAEAIPNTHTGVISTEHINESYIIFSTDELYSMINKTFTIVIPDLWENRAWRGSRNFTNTYGNKDWEYKPINIRPTIRSFKSGWQRANLNIINYKWIIYRYPQKSK